MALSTVGNLCLPFVTWGLQNKPYAMALLSSSGTTILVPLPLYIGLGQGDSLQVRYLLAGHGKPENKNPSPM